jgi:hypothetical protein
MSNEQERELRAAAERLVDAAIWFNRTAGKVLAHSAWRLKEEPWRRRGDGLRLLSAQTVELSVRMERAARLVEHYIFAGDRERDRIDYGEPFEAMPEREESSA